MSSNTPGNSASSWANVLEATEHLDSSGNLPTDNREQDVSYASDSTDEEGDLIDLVGGEDTPKDPKGLPNAGDSKKVESNQKASGDKDVITVTDETGRKRKVEIDYSDREAVKRAYAAAAGMRKFQAERDQAIQGKKATFEELSKLKNDWSLLEEAHKKGPDALFDLASGKPGAFEAYVQQRIQKELFLQNASPAEKKALEERERGEAQAKELERIRKENEDFRKKMTEEREIAETRALESRVHPAFDKYRFAGKLGNAEDEQLFDEMLWNSTLNRLKPFEEQGLDLSPELIESEFRKVATAVQRRMSVQADKKASQVVAQKKQEATENVQAKVKSQYAPDSDRQKLQNALRDGDTNDIFKNWGSFKNILGKRK